MSILNYQFGSGLRDRLTEEKRHDRDVLGDLKHGLDLIFELKSNLDMLHPMASETLIRLLSN
jgi:hypothetical protein